MLKTDLESILREKMMKHWGNSGNKNKMNCTSSNISRNMKKQAKRCLSKESIGELEKRQIIYLHTMSPKELRELKLECELVKEYMGINLSALSFLFSAMALFLSLCSLFEMDMLIEGAGAAIQKGIGLWATIIFIVTSFVAFCLSLQHKKKQVYSNFLLKCIEQMEQEAP